ncbi:PREDICTED: cytochrome P450 4F22-like [Thamnophis sirtalis]|uniref:Cytochrome P450 4F22-like n=1 Tax=Thamnophis sirtalis TaxID=35019 RepID=A0A6I9YIX9_9SAUR|nr:PREDICTED: cytochrome P450 4F22-like [Thamnophis sirtalis]
MLPLTDLLLEKLAVEKTWFRTMVISSLLLCLLALLIQQCLKVFDICYRYYVNCQRLRSFPQPPRFNWLVGHLGMITPTEEGMAKLVQIVSALSPTFIVWMGPFLPVFSLVHPDYIKQVLTASGTVVVSGEETGNRLGGGFPQLIGKDSVEPCGH